MTSMNNSDVYISETIHRTTQLRVISSYPLASRETGKLDRPGEEKENRKRIRTFK